MGIWGIIRAVLCDLIVDYRAVLCGSTPALRYSRLPMRFNSPWNAVERALEREKRPAR